MGYQTTITKKNSRYWDLAELEEARDKGVPGAAEKLEIVYKQAKQEELELARRELIDAHKEGDHQKIQQVGNKIRNYEPFKRFDLGK